MLNNCYEISNLCKFYHIYYAYSIQNKLIYASNFVHFNNSIAIKLYSYDFRINFPAMFSLALQGSRI